MKRFIIFAYQDYYPCGGMNDYMASEETLDEAIAWCLEPRSKYGKGYEPEAFINVFGNVEIWDTKHECGSPVRVWLDGKPDNRTFKAGWDT